MALGVLDYVFFVLNLSIGAIVGAYFLLKGNINNKDDAKKRSHKSVSLESCKSLDSQELQPLSVKFASGRSNSTDDNKSETDSTEDYFISHGHMALFPAVCSMFASNYSAISLLALPGG